MSGPVSGETLPHDSTPDSPAQEGAGNRVHTGNLGWTVFRTTAAQIIGRNLIALGRLGLASLVVRKFGKEAFGEYSLILVLLAIAEWLIDFGTNDVAVREMCQKPGEESRLLRVMTAVKAVIQVPAAYAALALLVLALRYPARIAEPALIGGASLALFGGILCYRVVFRVSLHLEYELLAEVLSVAAMILMVLQVARQGGGLSAVFGCYVLSRAIFLLVAFLLGRRRYQPSMAGVHWRDVAGSLRASWAIGLIGLLVVSYETMDVLLLSRLANISEVASYSGAQRFILPVLTSLSAVGSTLYPIVSSYWPQARAHFEEAFQRGLDAVVALAGLAACLLLAGSEFLVSLLSSSLSNAVPALRVLAIVCFAKAVSTTVGPVLYAVHKEKPALRFVGIALVIKAVLISVLAPRYGCMGAAFGTLGADFCFAVVSALMAQRFTGYAIRWGVPLRLMLISLCAAGAPRLFSLQGIPAMAIALPLYCSLALASGAVRGSELRALLKGKKS